MPRPRLPNPLVAPFRGAINREPSQVLARAVPWASVLLGSLVTGWPTIAATPLLPPLGFLLLLGWVQLRPGLLPPWAGLALGVADDLVSGQPLGSAVLLWSAALLVLEWIEFRWPWRNFVTEWSVAACLVTACLLLQLSLANLTGGAARVVLVLPQLALSVLAYPLSCRLVAWCDRARLVRLRSFG